MKPRVFIGSSTEGLSVAYALQDNLDRDAVVTVWTQDVFRPSKFILESLTDQLDKADVGIFVFSADDVVRIRGVEHAAARDNVIFEYGLYVGRLGRHRSFVVAPVGIPIHLPSDLLGMNYLTYQHDRTDGSLKAALGSASNAIRFALLEVEPKSESVPAELKLSFPDRRDLLGKMQRDILREIENVDSISFPDLKAKFPKLRDIELAYRIDNLRLQMFISPTDSSLGLKIYEQTFTTSKGYKKYSLNRSRLDISCNSRHSYKGKPFE